MRFTLGPPLKTNLLHGDHTGELVSADWINFIMSLRFYPYPSIFNIIFSTEINQKDLKKKKSQPNHFGHLRHLLDRKQNKM